MASASSTSCFPKVRCGGLVECSCWGLEQYQRSGMAKSGPHLGVWSGRLSTFQTLRFNCLKGLKTEKSWFVSETISSRELFRRNLRTCDLRVLQLSLSLPLSGDTMGSYAVDCQKHIESKATRMCPWADKQNGEQPQVSSSCGLTGDFEPLMFLLGVDLSNQHLSTKALS